MKLKRCLFAKKYNYEVVDGKIKINFSKPIDIFKPTYFDTITLPCRRCIYCQTRYSTQWAARCVLESKLHKKNCFLTLTYNNDNLPGPNLVKRDYQLFLKRLRKKVGKIRYFLAGEYGGKGFRPHFHIIVFGWCPDDLKYFKKDGKSSLYLSETVSKLWGKGFISVGIDMSVLAMKYTAKYLSKLQKIPPHITQLPFTVSSTRPGIAADCFDSSMLDDGGIFVEGYKYSLPRYFMKLAKKQGLDSKIDELKLRWKEKSEKFEDFTYDDYGAELYEYMYFCKQKGISWQHLYHAKKDSFLNVLYKDFVESFDSSYDYWHNLFRRGGGD